MMKTILIFKFISNKHLLRFRRWGKKGNKELPNVRKVGQSLAKCYESWQPSSSTTNEYALLHRNESNSDVALFVVKSWRVKRSPAACWVHVDVAKLNRNCGTGFESDHSKLESHWNRVLYSKKWRFTGWFRFKSSENC